MAWGGTDSQQLCSCSYRRNNTATLLRQPRWNSWGRTAALQREREMGIAGQSSDENMPVVQQKVMGDYPVRLRRISQWVWCSASASDPQILQKSHDSELMSNTVSVCSSGYRTDYDPLMSCLFVEPRPSVHTIRRESDSSFPTDIERCKSHKSKQPARMIPLMEISWSVCVKVCENVYVVWCFFSSSLTAVHNYLQLVPVYYLTGKDGGMI